MTCCYCMRCGCLLTASIPLRWMQGWGKVPEDQTQEFKSATGKFGAMLTEVPVLQHLAVHLWRPASSPPLTRCRLSTQSLAVWSCANLSSSSPISEPESTCLTPDPGRQGMPALQVRPEASIHQCGVGRRSR